MGIVTTLPLFMAVTTRHDASSDPFECLALEENFEQETEKSPLHDVLSLEEKRKEVIKNIIDI